MMLRKMTTVAAVALAFTSLSASAATITAQDIYSHFNAGQYNSTSSTVDGITFTAAATNSYAEQSFKPTISSKILNFTRGIGVGSTHGPQTSVGEDEIGQGETLTAAADHGNFTLSGTTIVFLYSANGGFNDATDEQAIITGNYADGTSTSYTVTQTMNGATVANTATGAMSSVSANSSGDTAHGDGQVALGALFGSNALSSLIFTAPAVPTACTPTTSGYPQCVSDADFALAQVDTAAVPEPASIAMFGLGLGLVLIGLGLRRRNANLG